MIKYGFAKDEFAVSQLKVTYDSIPDCCADSDDDYQNLILESVDNGVAPFIRMRIEGCGYWSVSDVSDLFPIFNDFNEKLNYHDEPDAFAFAPPVGIIEKVLEKYASITNTTIDKDMAKTIQSKWT